MFVVKQTRAFPPEFTVFDHEDGHGNGVNSAVFHGPKGSELAEEYAAFKNGLLTEKAVPEAEAPEIETGLVADDAGGDGESVEIAENADVVETAEEEGPESK